MSMFVIAGDEGAYGRELNVSSSTGELSGNSQKPERVRVPSSTYLSLPVLEIIESRPPFRPVVGKRCILR